MEVTTNVTPWLEIRGNGPNTMLGTAPAHRENGGVEWEETEKRFA